MHHQRKEGRLGNIVTMANQTHVRHVFLISVAAFAHGFVLHTNSRFHGIDTPRTNQVDLKRRSRHNQFRNRRQSEQRDARIIRDDEAGRDLIVGGTIVSSQSFRSFAVPDPLSSNGLCGATLIHSDILISAAHCGVADIFAAGTLLNIGSLSIYGEDAVDRIEVVNQMIHPNFNADTLTNDVMLIQIASPSSAPLTQWNTDPSLPVDAESLTVIGFGKTERGTASAVLREGTVYEVDTETCDAAYQLSISGEQNICAGSDTSSACSGDSGGPLFRNGVLVGLVSFGIVNSADGSCLVSRDLPNGYTRVSAMSDFISEGVCTLSANPPASCFLQQLQPAPAPTKIPTQSPTTPAPVTASPTQTPRTITISPATTTPRTLPPLFSSLFSASPGINTVSLPPSVRATLSPSYKPSERPSWDLSSSPTMEQTFVPSDVPTIVHYSTSSLPTNKPSSSDENADLKDNINITIITLPRPKSDATNRNTSNPTLTPAEANQTATSIGTHVHIVCNIGIVMIAVLYGICAFAL
jgi:Trypsin